jgi:hypothetical protein
MSFSLPRSTQHSSADRLRSHFVLLAVLLMLGAGSFTANEDVWPDGTVLLPESIGSNLHRYAEPASSTPALPSHCAEHCVHVVHGRVDAGLLATGEPLFLKLQPRRLALVPFLSPPPLTPPPQ